jgi:hypothetical protein
MDIKSLNPTDFVKAYSGRHGCCCGCRGTYYEVGTKSGDAMVRAVIKKINAADPKSVDIGPNYIAIENKTRQWILYTDK